VAKKNTNGFGGGATSNNKGEFKKTIKKGSARTSKSIYTAGAWTLNEDKHT
jgi:hypothetical protein